MSIRLRLTLIYSCILAVTLVAFAIFVYALLTHNLLLQIDGSLNNSANAAARIPRALAGDAGPGQAERQAVGRDAAARNGALPAVAGFPAGNQYLQYVDAGGAVVRSQALVDAGITLPVPQGHQSRRTYESVTAGDQDFRLLILPVSPARGGGLLELAQSLTDMEQTQAHLRVVLGLGALGALVLAGVTGWALATIALRPIDRLTQAAQEIGEAQDFSRRVAYRGPRDEVGRLAGTFNEMLGRLQAAYARIQRALEAQRRFVADASHELRTPLTTIRGNVELLELDQTGEPEERMEALHDIASEAERMSRLVTDLLVLARADAGLHIRRSPVELRPLVEAVCRQVGRTSADVSIELGQVPDVTVLGSEDHLKQLILILLDNARKYSPVGGVVRVSVETSSGWLRLSVSDDGPGISPEDQERIFDRFYRLDASRHGQGAGLGLAIARWIASEHDGSLTVTSAAGAGSTFIVTLPLVQSVLPQAERRSPAAVGS